MDYGALAPEINSGRIYAGPGPGSMLAAAAAWNELAAELRSAASSYGSVISGLTSGPWVGPSSTAMAAAAAPYVAWMGATAEQAELAATQAQVAAGAYATAFAATVPPPLIAANRAELMLLTATNFFGQNTPAIAATEAQYTEMWAQDAGAMYGYAANSAAATSQVTPFVAAPETTNAAGLAAQGTASTAAAGSSIGTGVQSALSQLISQLSTTLQGLASPLTSALSGSSSATTSVTSPLGVLSSNGFSVGGIAGSLIAEYGIIPGWAGLSMASSVFGPLFSTGMNVAAQQAMQSAAAAGGAAAGAAAAGGALGPGFAGGFGGLPGLGGLAGIGQAASVGGLSVPPSWGWAATAPGGGGLPILAPAAVPLAGDDVAAGLGFPFMFGPLGRAAAVGAAVGAGAAAVKYGPRLKVLARSPAAGYSNEPLVAPAPPTPKYPVPNGFPTNGHAPPGYQPAIVYVPINGAAPADA